MSSASQVYFMDISGIESDIAHIFEHAYVDAICGQLERHYKVPISLLCSISATTFQKITLLNVSAVNERILSKLNDTITSHIKIDRTKLNVYKSQVEAEMGKLYQVRDDSRFTESINQLEKRHFQPVDGMPGIRLDRINYHEDLPKPVILTGRKYPNSFDDIAINIDIDQPTITDRVVLAAIKDYLTDIVRNSVGLLGGYTRSSFYNECTDDSILLKINCTISKRATLANLSDAIGCNISKILNAPATFQKDYLHSNINSNFIDSLYNYLGVLGPTKQLAQYLTVKNLTKTTNKLGVYSIYRQNTTASGFNYDSLGNLFPR